MKQLRRSVFTRFVAFFLLTIAPICAIAIVLYNWQIRQLDRATVAAFETSARHGFANADNELAKVKSLSFSSLLDEDLVMLSGSSKIMTNYQKTVSINRYIRRMETLKSSSDYIERIATYIPSLNRVIDDEGNLSPDPEEVLQVYAASQRQLGWHFTVRNDRLYYVFLSPGASAEKADYTFLLVVEISRSRIQTELAGIGNADSLIFYDDRHTYAAFDRKPSAAGPVDLRALVERGGTDAPHKTKASGGAAWVVNERSEYSGLNLAAYLPVAQINPQMRELRWYFIVFSLAIVLSVLVLTFLTAKLIKKPLSTLVSAFGKVEQGNLGLQLEHRKDDEFRYIYRSFNAMVAKIKDLLEQVYEQRILAQSAQLKQLQSQINPHFLYNSFFVIRNMARLHDHESITQFAEYLARYYRFITQKRSGDIPLAEEAEYSRIYADIQKIRFGDRVRIEFGEVPPAAADKPVPRLIVQPLVENAFEHGIENSEDEEGVLRVAFGATDGKLTVSVENSGEIADERIEDMSRSLEQASGEVGGMINIHKRLQLLYGQDSGLAVSRSELGGLKVVLTIDGSGSGGASGHV